MPAAGSRLYDPEEVIPVIFSNKGHMQATADQLGISRQTLSYWKRDTPEILQAFKDARAEMVDNAELALYNAVLDGEAWAVKYYLSTQGQDRGYVERVEIKNMVEQELQVVVEMLEEELAPDVFMQVAAVLARRMT
jgi:hypothetical protein